MRTRASFLSVGAIAILAACSAHQERGADCPVIGSTAAHRVGWFGASDFPEQDNLLAPKTKECLAVHGCPKAVQLPTCPHDARTTPNWWTHPGKAVTLAGSLETFQGGMTQAKCGDNNPCCNVDGSVLVVRSDRGRVALTSARPAFYCSGDQSAHCCPVTPLGSAVLARGTLSAPFQLHNYQLDEPAICVFRAIR